MQRSCQNVTINRVVFVGKVSEGTRLSGRSTSAQNWQLSAIPRNSVTRTCTPPWQIPLWPSTINNQHPDFFTDRMPFLSPNRQCQMTEGKQVSLYCSVLFYKFVCGMFYVSVLLQQSAFKHCVPVVVLCMLYLKPMLSFCYFSCRRCY